MFVTVDADTPKLQEKSFQIRYQVYCLEKAYEDPDKYPDGLETDSFDSHSAHILLEHRPSGRFIGTTRLVLPIAPQSEWSFPLQLMCAQNRIGISRSFPIDETAEVSRFCISRRIRTERSINSCDEKAQGASHPALDMTIAMMEGIFRKSVEAGVTHLCAAMEPSLLRLLARLSIYFRPFGPLVDFHGKRQPCWQKLSILFDRAYREQKDTWRQLTADGVHWETLQNCRTGRHPLSKSA
jgi:N-acyl amino acid synthase of PEP-CTERM/exosortase system